MYCSLQFIAKTASAEGWLCKCILLRRTRVGHEFELEKSISVKYFYDTTKYLPPGCI